MREQMAMPELPDVEGFRKTLDEHAAGRRIERVEVLDAGVLRGTGARVLSNAVTGQRFRTPDRHGKWLLARTDGPTVLMHFGMTGSLQWCSPHDPRHRHDRVVFVVDGGELRYRDMRKLQGLQMARDANAVEQALGQLGPDALSVDRGEFDRLLSDHRGAVKAVLVDQGALAGLGNLLADEILWRARVHPRYPARDLPPGLRRGLYEQMRKVLHTSVRAGHVPTRRSGLTGVRDDRDATCPRCGTRLSRRRVSGRSTVWCPRCQSASG